ncbi:zinc metalloprotease HtpX [Candidatus Saccharibacteria bacterium]|nr:zinc metalloprotease HtpX [Candidatus Saccharibacteria bacterium]MCB9834951.1 zinc metalloprotease HtpX [Candidatus Nomurabacteria bacterium]
MYQQIASNKRKTWLLIISFIVLLSVISYGLYLYYGDPSIIVTGVVFSLVYSYIGYLGSAKLALSVNHAKPIDKSDAPEVYRMVENLAITAGLPMPKVYIISDPALNAFATGRDPEHAHVAMTSGIINALDQTELEGVIGHELSHIKNYDIRIMTIIIALVGIISLLTNWVMRLNLFGRDDDNRSNNPIGLIIMIASLIIAPIVANLIKLAISRKREYLADASSAMLTRYPEGLADALEKISGHSQLVQASPSSAHLFIANPLKSASLSRLFSTHPPIQERIKILRSMDQ